MKTSGEQFSLFPPMKNVVTSLGGTIQKQRFKA